MNGMVCGALVHIKLLSIQNVKAPSIYCYVYSIQAARASNRQLNLQALVYKKNIIQSANTSMFDEQWDEVEHVQTSPHPMFPEEKGRGGEPYFIVVQSRPLFLR